jgi:hypothetical protein
VTLCLAATGCDSSPYAASVNGQVIKETALNRQLDLLASNKKFITDTIEASTADDGEGIQVTGQANGSYTAAWSADVLTAMVTAEVVHQHLVRANALPDAAQLAMARAVDSADYSGDLAWYRFSPEVRSIIVQRDAELARVVPVDTKITAAQLKGLYESKLQTSLFTNVCVRDVDVDVDGAGGGIDYPASLAKAKALVSAIDAAGVSGAGAQSFGGSVTCYSHALFEQQSLGLIGTVLGIKAGSAAAPKKSEDGYQVFAVTKRTLVPYGLAFVKAVSALVQVDSINSGGSTLPALETLVAEAHVKVDPAYGTWRKTKSGYAVVPPSGPASHAATVAGAV